MPMRKWFVYVSALIGITLLVAAAYFYIYETRSTGLLPYIDYPLRPYALPVLVLGFALLILGVVVQFAVKQND